MEEPKWNYIDTINNGKIYENGDGIKVADFNMILENINYLKIRLNGRID
jgi:hypothetical protein